MDCVVYASDHPASPPHTDNHARTIANESRKKVKQQLVLTTTSEYMLTSILVFVYMGVFGKTITSKTKNYHFKQSVIKIFVSLPTRRYSCLSYSWFVKEGCVPKMYLAKYAT